MVEIDVHGPAPGFNSLQDFFVWVSNDPSSGNLLGTDGYKSGGHPSQALARAEAEFSNLYSTISFVDFRTVGESKIIYRSIQTLGKMSRRQKFALKLVRSFEISGFYTQQGSLMEYSQLLSEYYAGVFNLDVGPKTDFFFTSNYGDYYWDNFHELSSKLLWRCTPEKDDTIGRLRMLCEVARDMGGPIAHYVDTYNGVDPNWDSHY